MQLKPRKFIRRTEPVFIHIEDDRTGMSVETLHRAFIDNLHYIQGKAEAWATPHDYYMALAYTVRDRLIHCWIHTQQTYFEKEQEGVKFVCYLSAEYLLGPQLASNLINTGLFAKANQVLKLADLDMFDLLEQEDEPGLGNGGLGRLAACYLDSLATLGIPSIGYGIRYEFGIFEQVIRSGWQVERPDQWLRYGNPWEIARPEYRVEVKLGGRTEASVDSQGRYNVNWIAERTVIGTPFDTPVSG